MALTDFTFYLDGSITAVIALNGVGGHPDAPVASGQIYWQMNATSSTGAAVPKDASYTNGLTRGAIRGIFRLVNEGATFDRAGLACMLSAEDLRAGNNTQGYAALLRNPDGVIQLVKMTDGFFSAISGLNDLATSASGLFTDDAQVTLELAWDATAPTIAVLGGPVFAVRIGTASDYSDLTEVSGLTNVVDDTSPYTTTVAEALGGFSGNGSMHFYSDQLQLAGP